jgi:hypothetical protein
MRLSTVLSAVTSTSESCEEVGPSYRRARRSIRAGAAAIALVACGALTWYTVDSHGASKSPPARTHPSGQTTTSDPRRPKPAQEQPGWTVVTENRGAIVADRRTSAQRDGNVITVYRFRASQVRFALHVGSEDPPGLASAVGPGAGPQISPAEARVIVAAFNGGFKVASGSGGFELGTRALVPLQVGAASLVIDSSGGAHVGVWGKDVPYRGEQVVSVRQNLQPLVMAGKLSPLINDVSAWGSPLGGAAVVARSALGEDAHGNILYAAGMSALPLDLGVALIDAGAVRAMELDINPEWVQLESTPHPGGVLVAGIPNQNRPGDQYSIGWTRDFVTVTER